MKSIQVGEKVHFTKCCSTLLLIMFLEVIKSRKWSSPHQKKCRHLIFAITVKCLKYTTDRSQAGKVESNITYHPPVVDIRGQLHVVSSPDRWDIWVVILIKPTRNARVSDAAWAGTCLLLQGVLWWQPMRTYVAGHQLHSPWLLPPRWLQVVEADTSAKRDGEEEWGEKDENQRGQENQDPAGTSHSASFLRPTSSSTSSSTTSTSTSTSCHPDGPSTQPGPELGESGNSPGWTPTPWPPAPAPVPVQGGGRDAAPPWPCPHPWACHCPQPTPSSFST